MNISDMNMINETVTKRSSRHEDLPMILAGHLLIIFYCFIFIFGFIGNLAVIYVGIRKKKYRNVTNCYVINLALADLLFLLLSIPYTTYLALVDSYPFGETFCKIHMYLAYVFLLATCNTLAAMSVDRYVYIVLPRSKLKLRTSRNAFIVCIMIWIGSLVLIIPYHMITINLQTCGINEQKNFLVCFFVFCTYYAIPLVIIIICYTKLAMHVIQSNRFITNQINNKHIPNSSQVRRRRITRMVIIVTLAFALCWLPIHILELMKCADSSILYTLIQSHPKLLYTIRVITHGLAYLNSCLNPYLYAFLNHNFCLDLVSLGPKRFSRLNQSNFFSTKLTHANLITFSKPEIISNEQVSTKRLDNNNDDDEDDEDDDQISGYEQINLTNLDTNCQPEAL